MNLHHEAPVSCIEAGFTLRTLSVFSLPELLRAFMHRFLPLLLWCLLPAIAPGQSLWRIPYQPNQVVLETVVPQYETDRFEGGTGAAFLTGTYSLSSHIEGVVELPLSHATAPSTSSTALGNPYVGLGIASTTLPILVEVGARLPLGDDSIAREAATGITDPGRTAAFGRNERSLSALLNVGIFLWPNTSLRLRGGSTYAIFDDAADAIDRDVRLHYGAQLWRQGEPLTIGLTFTGVGVPSDAGSFAANSRHHLGATVLLDFDSIALGPFIGVSLDKTVRDVAPYFVGLTLSLSHTN